ncbi:RSC9 [Sanghuangporus weigelae]
MSGYTRGGVQMAYRATPTPMPATGMSGYAAASQYGSGYTQQTAAYAQRMPQTLRDDYERWYTEPTPTNRMLLSLRSGLDSEVSWALERLCRLSCNDQFTLSSIPGLVDALFEWPEWYLSEYGRGSSSEQKGKSKMLSEAAAAPLFAPSFVEERHRRYALESLFILRNAAVGNQNASELSAHAKTRPLIVRALDSLDLTTDENTQFILYCLELLHCLAGTFVLPSANGGANALNLVPTLERIAGDSTNRSMIMASLSALTLLFNIPQNMSHINESSPALAACVRYLPLYQDKALVDACLNFIYAHLSSPPMTKAFLLHPDLPHVLKVLVGYILSQQEKELATLDITAPGHQVPIVKTQSVVEELTEEELEKLGVLSEPERCYQWLHTAIKPSPEEELTQVEYWNAYKDAFTRFSDRAPLLPASDVIKNASIVYPHAQAMVLQAPVQRFIIRGITKRTKLVVVERNVCRWDRSQCQAGSLETPDELRQHVRSHLESLQSENSSDGADFSCKWATCQHSAPSLAALVPHVWTHVPLKTSATPTSSDPDKFPKITLASANEQYPLSDATQRLPPPDPKTVVLYPSPSRDPPSGSLTALLILRTLFRASFASSDAAPRVDSEHFGFPGVVEEADEQEIAAAATAAAANAAANDDQLESDKERERRGRRAFLEVRHLMESVQIKDPALMSWIYEMVDPGVNGAQ